MVKMTRSKRFGPSRRSPAQEGRALSPQEPENLTARQQAKLAEIQQTSEQHGAPACRAENEAGTSRPRVSGSPAASLLKEPMSTRSSIAACRVRATAYQRANRRLGVKQVL